MNLDKLLKFCVGFLPCQREKVRSWNLQACDQNKDIICEKILTKIDLLYKNKITTRMVCMWQRT